MANFYFNANDNDTVHLDTLPANVGDNGLYLDSSFTILATVLPGTGDTVYLTQLAPAAPSAPMSFDILNAVDIQSDNTYDATTTIQVISVIAGSSNYSFYWDGNATGACNLGLNAVNYGTVGDNSIFSDNAVNNYSVGNNTVFNDVSSCENGTIGSWAIFNDTSSASSTTFAQQVVFNDEANTSTNRFLNTVVYNLKQISTQGSMTLPDYTNPKKVLINYGLFKIDSSITPDDTNSIVILKSGYMILDRPLLNHTVFKNGNK